ncbi:hypothetical protein [Rubritalea marina]|uniref:hypothetical protein n=1 Tax=Rubritalea marina TaxID=361055 RepID=UPI00035D6436|nr:hypothetical protein [Rubritalea marina]
MQRLSPIILSILSAAAHAQVLSPSSLQSPSSNSFKGNSNSADASNTTIHRNKESGNSIHGEEVPLLDPTSKTFTFQGRTYSLMDNNLGGQFEAYLASSEYETKDAVEYRENIQKILGLLSPLNPGGPDLKQAYTILETIDYQGDGGICDSLANSIYSSRLAMKGIGSKKEAIAKLEREEKRLAHNMKVLETKGELGGSTKIKVGSGNSATTTTTKTPNSTEYKIMQKRLIEIVAIKKKYEASGVISLTQSKVQYQAMMLQLFMQRRYEHVVMAARAYNIIFKDGDQALRIKKGSDTEKFFSEGMGVNPTVSGLDAAANEAIHKTENLVDAFQNNLNTNRIHAASERLVEAYALGEFMPSVQTVSYGSKERIQQYVQDANDLIEALSAKELVLATELNDLLKKQARDYNGSKANAYIAGHKRASTGYVRDAKFALFENDSRRAKVALESALKHWPTNPAIQEFNEQLDKRLYAGQQQSDMGSSTIKEFDRLLSDKNYRAIVEEPRKSKFVTVLGQLNDQERLKILEEIANSVREIETALAKSKSLEAAGQAYAAWEAIYETQNKYYDDPKIANAKAQLISKVGNFTTALNKAHSFETNEVSTQSGSALSWYLKAREIYPQSRFAKEGIDRVVGKKF